jgi:putative aldouronate transport system substrate-binding protein
MRKRTKSFTMLFAVLLVVALVFSACSSQQSAPQSSPSPAAPTQPAAGNTSEGEAKKELPPYELVVAFMYFGSEQKDTALVQEEISKITKEKINATVKLMPLSISAYTQQMNLVLSGNEKLDLLFVSAANFAPFTNRGQLIALDELLEQEGQGIKEAVGDFMEATKVNGTTYAVPSIRDYAASYGFVMRKDLVEKHNIDVSAIKTFDDVGDVLRTIKKLEPGMEPLGRSTPSVGIVDFGFSFDDSLRDMFGVLPNYDNGLKVSNRFEQDYYVEMLHKLHGWYKEGLILKDIATNQSSRKELVDANKVFGWFNHMKPGYVEQVSREMGREMVTAEIVPPISTTSTVANVTWGIARNSTDPERAMKFLNLMYTDPEIVNLLTWGIEGKHYVKKDGGVVGYPDGVNIENSGYAYNLGWMMGNQFLSHVWEGTNPEIWRITAEFNKNATKSKALGFSFDSSTVQTELASVTNVMDQFRFGLETGTLNPEKTHPDFANRLKAAGIDKIIEEKQRQLDAWLEAKK